MAGKQAPSWLKSFASSKKPKIDASASDGKGRDTSSAPADTNTQTVDVDYMAEQLLQVQCALIPHSLSRCGIRLTIQRCASLLSTGCGESRRGYATKKTRDCAYATRTDEAA